ncbi:MAG: M56 family metallopeptidase, partial [Clostridia bacterium]|nr:M56 family metallopeptidase [Clostridia bacterium]
VKSRIGTAVLLHDNIYFSERVASPFVLGIIKPKIYLPFNLSEQDSAHVIAHEMAHIRRGDHLWKPLGFLLLTLHWFNPLMWIGYVILCRDIELACDEKVISSLDSVQKADYSQALLSCSVSRRAIAACPLAFGEVAVKSRIKSILNYKKPAFWIIIVAIIASIAAAVCFLTNPATTTLGNIEGADLTDDIVDTTRIWAVKENGESYNFIGAIPRNLLRDLANIRISKREVSKNREDRKAAHSLVLHPRQTEFDPTSSDMFGIYINFDEDFKTVFLDGDAVPTLTYKIKNPKEARAIYDSILACKTEEPLGDINSSVEAITDKKIDSLKKKFPEYFACETSKGLEVYVWQMAHNVFNCGVLPGVNLGYTQQELLTLANNPATLYEMRIIIAHYLMTDKITKDEVSVIGIQMAHSSYAYKLDERYKKQVRDLFWENFPIIENTSFAGYMGYIAAATFDVDGDGRDEDCVLGYGPTSGLFSFTFTASENGTPEYYNVFTTGYMELGFDKNADGEPVLVGKNGDDVKIMKISVVNGNIVLDGDEYTSYWGKQGLDTPVASRVKTFRSYQLVGSTMTGFSLFDNGTFSFHWTPTSSYIGFGNYTWEDGLLTLRTHDEKYVLRFRQNGENMVYELTDEGVWGPPFTDGDVFTPHYYTEVEYN